MKIELDVHTHTIASGHAFSTLQEMAQAAADKGLKVLGITEHSPGVPGTCHPIYFRNLHVVPRRMYGVELLLGAEINILDGKGNLELDEDYMKMLDIRIEGILSLCAGCRGWCCCWGLRLIFWMVKETAIWTMII